MSTHIDDFVKSSEEYINKQISDVEEQIKTLKISTGKMDDIFSFIKKILSAVALAGFGSGYTKETELAVEKYVDKLISSDLPTGGLSSNSDKLESSAVSMLGGLLSTEPEAVFSFIDISADNYLLLLRQKRSHLEEMKAVMAQLDTLVASLDPSWYSIKFPSRLNSASSILSDAVSTLGDMSNRSYNGIVDVGGIVKVTKDIDGSISYLSDDDNISIVSDICNLTNKLEKLNEELLYLEKDCVERHLGLLTSKDSFIEASGSNQPIFDFYRDSLNSAYSSVMDIRDQMNIAEEAGIDSQIANSIHLWISELASVKSVLSASNVDYAVVISDPTSPLVISLDNMLHAVDVAGIPVSGNVVDSVNSIIDDIRIKIGSDTSSAAISDAISRTNTFIDEDNNVSGNVEMGIETNRVNDIMSQATDLMDLLSSFSLDKMYSLMLQSKWGDILNYKNIAMTYVNSARIAINNLQAIYKKGFALDRALNVYYQISGMYGAEVSSTVDFESLEQHALDIMVNSKLPKLKGLLASTSKLESMFKNSKKKTSEDDTDEEKK